MLPSDVQPPELIQADEDFRRLAADLSRQKRIGVDTESNSLHAYREQVCLMQFSTEARDYVLDPLAVLDVGPLGAVFSDPGIEKIFHAAEYDILCLRRDFGFEFANIFDTMQAGRILGRKLAGLDRLLGEKFGVQVDKRLQKANWGARPLSPELLQYAAQDTHYLIPLRDLLEDELRQKDLLELAREDFRMACNHVATSPANRAESPSWSRLRARRDLTPQDLAILRELLDWREAEAARLDRPPFKVVSDEKLIAIARTRPTNTASLEDAGLTRKQVQQWAGEVLGALARGSEKPGLPRWRAAAPSPGYLKRLDSLKDWRKKAAAGMDVESDVILPRGLLLALAEHGAPALKDVMRSSPWRLQHFGDQITEILERFPGN